MKRLFQLWRSIRRRMQDLKPICVYPWLLNPPLDANQRCLRNTPIRKQSPPNNNSCLPCASRAKNSIPRIAERKLPLRSRTNTKQDEWSSYENSLPTKTGRATARRTNARLFRSRSADPNTADFAARTQQPRSSRGEGQRNCRREH